MGAPGVPQLVGATCGVQLAPPVSFFSLCGSLTMILKPFNIAINILVFFIYVVLSTYLFLTPRSGKKQKEITIKVNLLILNHNDNSSTEDILPFTSNQIIQGRIQDSPNGFGGRWGGRRHSCDAWRDGRSHTSCRAAPSALRRYSRHQQVT